eukprot:gene589-5029_t
MSEDLAPVTADGATRPNGAAAGIPPPAAPPAADGPVPSPFEVFVHVDGSHSPVAGGDDLAGWGFVAFARDHEIARAWGPVATDPADPLWRGAQQLTVGTAEVHGFLEAALWVLFSCAEAWRPPPRRVVVCYDSTYCAGVILGDLHAHVNLALVGVARRLALALRERGCEVAALKVPRNAPRQAIADALAKQGAGLAGAGAPRRGSAGCEGRGDLPLPLGIRPEAPLASSSAA